MQQELRLADYARGRRLNDIVFASGQYGVAHPRTLNLRSNVATRPFGGQHGRPNLFALPIPSTTPSNGLFSTTQPGPPSIVCAIVPHVVVDVTVDHPVLDASVSRDVWVAIEASICTKASTVPATNLIASSTASDGESAFRYTCGRITTLRMCYKAGASCTVTEVIGHKALKDLEPNQRCSLFIKVHVPAVRADTAANDQDSLFAEIESIVGTHGTQILGLEARYRHSLLPYDNVVAVRQPVRIRRTRSDLHWSMTID